MHNWIEPARAVRWIWTYPFQFLFFWSSFQETETDSEDEERERLVGFSPEVVDSPNRESRLMRKDTPHYLRDKRVSSGDATGAGQEEKVLKLLAQGSVSKPDSKPSLSGRNVEVRLSCSKISMLCVAY